MVVFFWRAWATALWLLGPLEMMESLVKLGIYEPTTMTLWWDGLHFNKIFSWMAGKTEHHKTCFLVDVFSSRQTSYFTRRSLSSIRIPHTFFVAPMSGELFFWWWGRWFLILRIPDGHSMKLTITPETYITYNSQPPTYGLCTGLGIPVRHS